MPFWEFCINTDILCHYGKLSELYFNVPLSLQTRLQRCDCDTWGDLLRLIPSATVWYGILFFFYLLYSCLILHTPVYAPLTIIKYHLWQAPRLFFTSNEPILKYCVSHIVAFFYFLSKTMFFSLFNRQLFL